MSALSIAADGGFRIRTPRGRAPRTALRRTSVRLTRRGRMVFLVLALCAVFGAMVTLGGYATATREAGTPAPVKVVEVQPGDTLYSIAGRVARPGHVREMVERIEQLNSLPDTALQAGDRIAVPAG